MTNTEAPATPQQVWACADLTLTPTLWMHRDSVDEHPKRHRAYDFYFGAFLSDMDRMISGGLHGIKFSRAKFEADSEEIRVFVEFAVEIGSEMAAALERWASLPREDITPADIKVANREANHLSYKAGQVLMERARAAGFRMDMKVTEVDSCDAPTPTK